MSFGNVKGSKAPSRVLPRGVVQDAIERATLYQLRHALSMINYNDDTKRENIQRYVTAELPGLESLPPGDWRDFR